MSNEFHVKISDFFKQLGSSQLMVLATSQDNKVTARMMSCVIIDGIIYFQTDRNSDKYKQLTENSNVALCIDNIQIEGVASVHGSTLDARNKFFAESYEQHHKGSFDAFSSLPDTIMIKVIPLKITLWEYDGKRPYRTFFDLEKQTYLKEYYLTKEGSQNAR